VTHHRYSQHSADNFKNTVAEPRLRLLFVAQSSSHRKMMSFEKSSELILGYNGLLFSSVLRHLPQ